VQESNLQPWD